MPQYNAQSIEQLFRSHASLRISKKRRDDSLFKNDAGYWDGGRCDWGGAHNLEEDCERLASFFTEIKELKNARNKLIKFDNQQEFERNKQNQLKWELIILTGTTASQINQALKAKKD